MVAPIKLVAMPLPANAVPMAHRPRAAALPFGQQVVLTFYPEASPVDAPRGRATTVAVCRTADGNVIGGQESSAAESVELPLVLRAANGPGRYRATGDNRENGPSPMPGLAAADDALGLYRRGGGPCDGGLKNDSRIGHKACGRHRRRTVHSRGSLATSLVQ